MSPSPFFLLGADRSGTTLLRSLLESRYLVAIPPESEFVRDLAPPPSTTLDDQGARALAARLRAHPRVRSWGVRALDLPVPRGGEADAVFRELVEAAFRTYAAHNGVSDWGDKTPSYLHSLDLLTRLWPSARLVFLQRDGRDVFCSVRPLPFGANTPSAAGRIWASAVRASRTAEQRWPDRVRLLSYEDLVADPDAVVGDLGAFLGLSPRTDEGPVTTTLDAGREHWFPRLGGPVDASSVGRWRSELSDKEISDFERAAGPELVAAGYPLAAPGLPSGRGALALQGAEERVKRLWHFAVLRLWRERGRELRYVVRRRLGR